MNLRGSDGGGLYSRSRHRLTLALVGGVVIIMFFMTVATPLANGASRRTPVVVAVERIAPAVVNINTSTVTRVSPFRRGAPRFDDLFFGRTRPQVEKRRSLGSGVIIREDGYIITNNHVIDGATAITVTLADDRQFEAQVVGADARSDLAVIKVESKTPLPAASLGRSDDLMIGETVITIGNPFGLNHTVTTGILSAVGRDITDDRGRLLPDFIQLDASINPGNSGGALLNINGELIGIPTAIFQSGEGIGFAIPIARARQIFEDIIAYGSVLRGWTGLFTIDLTRELRYRLGYQRGGGVIISKLFGGSPAEKAGARPGDIITHINGKKVSDSRDYSGRISSFTDSDTIKLKLRRFDRKLNITFKPKKITPKLSDRMIASWLGLRVTPNDTKSQQHYRLITDRGVVITKVDQQSELGKAGVMEGDIVRRLNRTEIDDIASFRNAVMEVFNLGGAVIFIQRGESVYQITIG